ncbi:MAG: hypoxanthine phosphoribosyltransferase, partial [Elusimicrobia bacterium]|nr:hypoxanthine phosphoribosyltransferase [Elusimicrobiota bacterium]
MKKIKSFISKETIEKKVSKIASQINKDYKGKKLFVVSILTGSVIFCSDILRKLKVD